MWLAIIVLWFEVMNVTAVLVDNDGLNYVSHRWTQVEEDKPAPPATRWFDVTN